ncbi:hypothetical protein MPTK1_5g04700 [Marchantia polymorpha subsp. ruderalis]|uniref:Uncharacterized protein n=2 Tax=Marchantia polymorpha TaxID=3197 RepID=A0AAF6BEZ3_MARPO|nr:hypothetical protein Mp_5g04700 [Marchantia polymorpha subsp. ruderalis]
MKHSTPRRGGAGKGFMAHMEEKKKLVVVIAAFLTSAAIVLLLNGLREHAIADLVQNLRTSALGGAPEEQVAPAWANFSNIYVPPGAGYSSTLHQLLQANGTTACHNQSTNFTRLEGLPRSKKGKVLLKTNTRYQFSLVAYTADGKRRCAGGDYYEVDLHNERYRARLPTTDFDNGTYGLELEVPARWAGVFSLEIWLLFGNWHGMDIFGEQYAVLQVVTAQELHVILPQAQLLDATFQRNMTRCAAQDFTRPHWSGRWTRGWFNEACEADEEKRFRCLPGEHFGCEEPWCAGPLGRLESNGWSYSAHCSFKIFERDEAWSCLDGRWLFMWGDSNFQDTVRNLLLFILDWQLPPKANLADFQLERKYEQFFINPARPSQAFQVSMVFNGANQYWDNGEGLHTLEHTEHQDTVATHFNGSRAPDTIIMNSGLHDGYKEIEDYLAVADFAVQWWVDFYTSLPADRKPQLVWRTTVAPAGKSRNMPGNPHKMESYNHVMVEKLRAERHRMPVKFVDGFDLTFPFHYTNEFSDGGHYGRAPGVALPPWHRKPHWYFVDIMLAHIFLNAICPAT